MSRDHQPFVRYVRIPIGKSQRLKEGRKRSGGGEEQRRNSKHPQYPKRSSRKMYHATKDVTIKKRKDKRRVKAERKEVRAASREGK